MNYFCICYLKYQPILKTKTVNLKANNFGQKISNLYIEKFQILFQFIIFKIEIQLNSKTYFCFMKKSIGFFLNFMVKVISRLIVSLAGLFFIVISERLGDQV